MADEIWTPENIRKAAESTGKPFEVECARVLSKRQWLPVLGTYYTDLTTELPREIDVGATRQTSITNRQGKLVHNVASEVFISCRGFSPDERIATYSLNSESIAYSKPAFLCNFRGAPPDYGNAIATHLLTQVFAGQPPVLSFEVLEAKQGTVRAKGDARTKGGKEGPYSALDSAIKASVFWHDLESTETGMSGLYVPIVTFPNPWIDIPLLNEGVGTPIERTLGYTTTLYPAYGRGAKPILITTLLACRSSLPALIERLDSLNMTFVCDAAKVQGYPIGGSTGILKA